MPVNQYISRIELQDFTLFSEMAIDFSKNINVISGETGVGKTNIMKALYSLGKTLNDAEENIGTVTSEKAGEMLASKLLGVFRPDNRKIGRLFKRKIGRGTAVCRVRFSRDEALTYSFTNLSNKTVKLYGWGEIEDVPKFIYLPAKEIISAAENFSALYEKYHIAFEETYYDLNKLLLLPSKKGPLNSNQKKLVKALESIVKGKVSSQDQKFYLTTQGVGKIEMGLLAEGYRKLATLLHLISNEVLTENTILFWDEPESNINPRMITALKDLLVSLAEMGVQIFITTHSYFLQQELALHSEYKAKGKLDIRFINLYKHENNIYCESRNVLSELEHNPIQKEFEELYNREQELFYDDSN